MQARTAALVVFVALIAWFSACSSGLGNDPRRRPQASTGSNSNRAVGIDLGVIPTDPAAEPAVAGFSIPAYGTSPARDVVLLGFSTAAAANDADGSGGLLSRDTTSDTNGAADVFVAAICAQDVETRAFSQSLAGKFRHPRCTTCHSMQAATTLAFVSSALPHAGPPPGPTFPNLDPSTCQPCHVDSTTFPVVGWQAPAASFDMRSDTVAQLADRATRIPTGDLEHFVSDARVLWALDSGILPTVGGRNGVADDDHDGVLEPEDEDGVPRTVPGGSVNFIAEIEAWNASGRVVTAATAVKDVTLVSRANGTSNAGNGASRTPKLLWVPNASFDPTSAATAALTNPVGTVYVVFESDASNLVGAGDSNGATDVYRAMVTVRVEEDATGAASPGGINLVYQDLTTVLVSAIDGTTTAGNGASTKPAIGGDNAQFIVFQSTATDLIAGFADANGLGADVYVRRVLTNATQLVSHNVGNAGTGGNGTSISAAIDATGVAVAFESDATDLIAADLNALRDVFHTRIDSGSPFTKVRSSVSDAGVEATGGASSACSIHVDGTRIRVAFQSDATDLAPSLTATTNVFLFDSTSGFTTLLNQKISTAASAIGNGSATSPVISTDGSRVAFLSAATNIDVVRTSDGNRSTDLFLVETEALAQGNVLPFRVSMTTAEAADANGSSSNPAIGSFDATENFGSGFLAYSTAATNLGAPDSTNLIVSFLNETSGVFADFSAFPRRGSAPLTVVFSDESTGGPTGWQWDFENDGTVDSTQQNPTHTYTTPGTYTVKLIASNANTNGERTEAAFVVVVGDITADFTPSVTSGTVPFAVTFTDTSTQSPTSWQWDFDNDGTIDSTVQNPVHAYTTAGTYTVRLVATNERGSATVTKTDVITAFEPVVANFTRSPTSGLAPLTVNFTNTSTGATSYAWDFDEDNVPDSTDENPSFQYVSSGTFDVTLTATGPGGTDVFTFADCVDVFGTVTASFTITVSGNPITSAYESTSIAFTNTSTGTFTTTAWDFDFVANPGSLTSSSTNVTRTFANTTTTTRVFAVRLTVSGPGGSSFAQANLTIVSDDETVNINPSADTTIYEDLTGNSNGAGTQFVVGRPAGTISVPPVENFSRRALMRFVFSSIPTGSTINSATLQLTADTPVVTSTSTLTINRLTQAFTEGTANSTAGTGTATAGSGATWLNRSGATAWTNAGGTFNGTASGTIANVAGPGTYTSTALTTDVANWFSGAVTNNGWIIRGNEGAANTAKRFFTREGTTPPVLTVNYTRPLP